jgi:hypothetical protein
MSEEQHASVQCRKNDPGIDAIIAAAVEVLRASHIGDQNFIPCLNEDGAAKLRVALVNLGDVFRQDQPQGTEARVCEDIASRQRFGIAKYGVTVEQSDEKFKAWLQHAYEEALDMAVYLKRAIETYSC